MRVIIDHIDKYPLITDKRADYQLFKQVVKLLELKEHLTLEGFLKILSIRASHPNESRLIRLFKGSFFKYNYVERPIVTNK